jgi:hypothetical protein
MWSGNISQAWAKKRAPKWLDEELGRKSAKIPGSTRPGTDLDRELGQERVGSPGDARSH